MRKTRSRETVEILENRQLMSVSLNSAGWTVVTPDSGAQVIYVSSSSGRDSNTGKLSSSPVASLAKAYSLMRNGTGDEMLLKRGDTWNGFIGQWKIGGGSASSPMLLGTYGSGNRPVIDCGTASGFVANTVHPVSNLVIQGIVFTDNSRDPTRGGVSSSSAAAQSTGFQLLGPSTNVTIEDCAITYFKDNVDLQNGLGAVNHITFRRDTIANSYCSGAHSQGFYATGVSDIILDQDVFDHNGWNSSISGAGITGFNHDIYYSDTCLRMMVTNSIIANASSEGVLARSGGVIDGNLFLNNAVGISFGNANGATSTVGGVVGQIENNIFMGDHAVGSTPLGEGIELGNIKPNSGVTVSGNIFADDNEKVQAAISLMYAVSTSNPSSTVGINDLTISNNIVDGWHYGMSISTFTDGIGGRTGLNNLKVTNNQFQNTDGLLIAHSNRYSSSQEHWSGNVYYTASTGNPFQLAGSYLTPAAWKSVDPTGPDQKVNYTAPTRTVATYSQSLGNGNSLAAFLAVADSQSESNWNSNYTSYYANSYLRAGFSTGTITNPVPPVTPTPPSAGTKFSGTVIGTAGSYQNDGNTIAKAVDGNLGTFFDGPGANGNWVGLDLGSARVITSIAYSSRSGWASRMNGGTFQASNSANFASGVVNLYTVGANANPSSTALTYQTVSNSTGFRYVRYLSPSGSFGDVAEVQFFGNTPAVTATKFSGSTIGTAGSYLNQGNVISKATDGNLGTFFDGPNANGGWVGLDLGSAKTVTQISYAPRAGWASRMVGGVFQASSTANFTSGVIALYTITSTPSQGTLSTVNVSVSNSDRYVRYLAPNGSYGDISELNFYG